MATLKQTNKPGIFYVLTLGEPTRLVKIGRYRGVVPSVYPWQYLRYRYMPQSNGRAKIYLMRHLVSSDPAKSIDAYERSMIKYVRSKVRPVYGTEWFHYTNRTMNAIRDALVKTDANLGAKPMSEGWLGARFKGSPKKPYTIDQEKHNGKTVRKGKPRGVNHVAREYAGAEPLRPRTNVADRAVTLNRLERAQVMNVTNDGRYVLPDKGGYYRKVHQKNGKDIYIWHGVTAPNARRPRG
jgi:hypothetical protein